MKIKTADVLTGLRKNREIHVDEYRKAQEGYRLEVLEQLEIIKNKLDKEEFGLRLDLVEPIDRTDFFDDSIKMFEHEIEEEIEMEQYEFQKYVLDKDPHVLQASISNTMYSSKFGL